VMALRYLQLEHCGTTEEHVDAGMAQLALVMAWIHSSVVSFSASDLNRLAFLPEDSRSRLSILEQVLGIGDWKDHISILRESLSWTGHIAPVSVPNGQLVKVDLPDKLTDLIKKTIGVKCERCESVPSEPAVCLVCGTVVCLDSECCKNETNEGECNQHSKTCGAGQGMFILPLASVVVAVGYPRNCIWDGPYVDVHGEPDSYLKRSCQLRLDRRRLDQMRLSYTRGSIPIEIVRQNQISGRYVPRQL
jgi:E3 ubiquitin-protein ligase UBR1